MCSDVFGPDWKHLRIAHLSTADRIGLELFEFDDNHAPQDNLSFRQHGTFHFAIQAPDLEDLLARIVAAGGKQRMPVREYFPGKKPYRMVYVEDPTRRVPTPDPSHRCGVQSAKHCSPS